MSLISSELVAQQIAIKETRVAGPITVNDVMERMVQEYDFGDDHPNNFHPLHRGLETTKYTFWLGQRLLLLKIYDQSASHRYRFRLRNQPALENKLIEAGIPISKTLDTKSGKSFIVLEKPTTPNRNYVTAASIAEIFPGSALQNPSVDDAHNMAQYMAAMHQITNYGVVPAMDTWSFLKLVQSYDQATLEADSRMIPILKTIHPVVEKVRGLGLEDEIRFPKRLVHGDLHPFNILKGESGYCIIDLGCMDHEQRVADLAIFMSMTCADFTDPDKTQKLFQAVIDSYEIQLKLTPTEKAALPHLIEANFAMFALRTAELLVDDPTDQEIINYHERGLMGLQFMQGFL